MEELVNEKRSLMNVVNKFNSLVSHAEEIEALSSEMLKKFRRTYNSPIGGDLDKLKEVAEKPRDIIDMLEDSANKINKQFEILSDNIEQMIHLIE